jgi:hypothetical protein
MIDWTEAENRMQAYRTNSERIDRQGWHQDVDRSSGRPASSAGGWLGRHLVSAVRNAPALCRTAGRLLTVPTHRGVTRL